MRATDYEVLFDLPNGDYSGQGVDGIRTVTYRAGRSLEVMCYPITQVNREARREAKRRRSTPAMEKLNARNSRRHRMRLLEANFSAKAFVVTLTYAYPVEDYGICDLEALARAYEQRGLPEKLEDAQRDFRNYLARVRRRLRKCDASSGAARHLPQLHQSPAVTAPLGRNPEGKAGGPLKWDVTIEWTEEPPVAGLPPKYHAHLIVEAEGLTRGMLEECWGHGATRIERFDLSNDGAARLANYLSKHHRKRSWWSHSRNLVDPQPTISDRKMSRRRLAKVAADVMRDGKAIFERLYPGYRLVELPEVNYSDFVVGAYIYARLRKYSDDPPWVRKGKKRE